MEQRFDAVVIGAGLNGLAAAAVLGAAGRRVLVVDRQETPGGASVRRTFHPGFSASVEEVGWVSPLIRRELGLDGHGHGGYGAGGHASDGHGIQWLPPEHTLSVLGVSDDPLVIRREPRSTAEALQRRSSADARQWPEVVERLARLAGFFEWLAHRFPPRATAGGVRELAGLAAVGRRARGLGREGMIDLARLPAMSVADFAEEMFEDPALRAAFAACGISGIQQGPRSGGTTYVLLHHLMGAAPGAIGMRARIRGGAPALADEFARAARAKGAALRFGTRVSAIRTDGDGVSGVALEDGAEIPSRIVLSSADVRTTLVDLIDPAVLDPELVRAVMNVRSRGVISRVHFALDRLPEVRGVSADALDGPLLVTPHLNGIERAYDDAKYGRSSERPVLLVRVPSVADPTLAPAGQHVITVTVQYTPRHRRAGEWSAADRDAIADRVWSILREHAPGLDGSVIARDVLTPADLEQDYAVPEGQLDHAELGLDQLLFMRPVPACARYATPVHGLFLCGAGQHPGRHVAGAAGYLAARAALAEKSARSAKRRRE